MIICLSLLIQKKPYGISSRAHAEKLVVTGNLPRKAGEVGRPPRYDKKVFIESDDRLINLDQ